MKRFLIADDHYIVRSGISFLIKEAFLNAEIDECRDGDSAWKKIDDSEYDLAIMDISMPGTDSINLIKKIFVRRPTQKVLILTMSSEDIYASKYLRLGVKGFINKEAEAADIRQAITAILNEKRYISPRLREILTQEVIEGKSNRPLDVLSARELEIMTLILEGKNISEIAHILCVHTSTIGTHKARILQKLGVSNVIELNKMVQLFSISPTESSPD
jgi:DNA-binding NarL/FixJ family response regulator